MHNLKRWYPIALALAGVAASLAVFDRLPDPMAVHWSLDGVANGWMPRAVGAFISPALLLATWGLLRLAPTLDPRRENFAKLAHRLAGYTMTIAGFVIVATALLLPPGLIDAVLIACVAAALAGPVVYSYLTWKREMKQ